MSSNSLDLPDGGSASFAASLPEAAIEGLKHNPHVLAVEADGPVSLCAQTHARGIVRIGADQFPVSHINGITEPLDVDVAVLDTGIDPHPDLTNVVHFYSPFTSDPSDELAHGTGVAGVIGALDNDFGVVGVAPGVRLWNIKVIGQPPNNGLSLVLNGMNHCVQNANQISVANMSFVNDNPNGVLGTPLLSFRNMIRSMVNSGIVVVAAVGNSTNDIAGPDGVFNN